MRIDPNQAAQSLPESSRSAAQNTAAPAPPSASGAFGEDQAQLSGAQAQVASLTAQALQFPEVRQEKVSALRQAVEEGSYQPSSDQVAGALFTHLLMPSAA